MFVHRGDSVNGHLAQELKALIEEERKLDELIQSCTWQVQQMCENKYSQRYPFFVISDEQIQIGFPQILYENNN